MLNENLFQKAMTGIPALFISEYSAQAYRMDLSRDVHTNNGTIDRPSMVFGA